MVNVDFLESFFLREKNEPLFKLYYILSSNFVARSPSKTPQAYGSTGITYNKISSLFTKHFGKKIKMDPQIVSHYCKKLEKHGFIICTTLQRNSERKVFLREAYFQKYLAWEEKQPSDLFNKLGLKVVDSNTNSVQTLEKISKLAEYDNFIGKEQQGNEDGEEEYQELPTITDVDFIEMTTKERIINLIDDPYKYLSIEKPDGLTISEISQGVGLSNQEKLVSRILSQIQKKNSWIRSHAFRFGRIFLYKYFSTRKSNDLLDHKIATNIDDKSENEVLPELNTRALSVKRIPQPSIARQIDLNEEWYKLLQWNTFSPEDTKEVVVREYFKVLLKTSTKKRSITIDTINRYIYTLNLVYTYEVVSMIDLKHHIKTDLERDCSWDIDKKTMKRMTNLLKQKGLISIYEFEVKYIAQSEHSDDSLESDEYVEYDSGSGEDWTYKVKKAQPSKKRESKAKAKAKNEAAAESIHSKMILTKPNIDSNDLRIQNDPSITNPSLRQDKELPNSILQKVIESKRIKKWGRSYYNQNVEKLQVQNAPANSTFNIEDLILKKEPSLKQKKMIDMGVQNSKIKTSSLNSIKLAMKLEGLFNKNIKDSYQAFYQLMSAAAIDRNKVVGNLCKWYTLDPESYQVAKKQKVENTEKVLLGKLEQLMKIDSLEALKSIEGYEDIPTHQSETKRDNIISKNFEMSDMLNDPLYEELYDYLIQIPRKKRNTHLVNNEGNNITSIIKQCVRKLQKGIDMNLLELRKDFPEGVWLFSQVVPSNKKTNFISQSWVMSNSALAQTVVLMSHLGLVELYKQKRKYVEVSEHWGNDWYYWIKLLNLTVPELDK